MNQILIIAHAPLAQALRQGLLHVFPDGADHVLALDVQAHDAPEHSLQAAHALLDAAPAANGTLVLADILGATPANVAQRLLQQRRSTHHTPLRALAGVNLPMLLRAHCYASLPLEDMLERALQGGAQGMAELDGHTAPPPDCPTGQTTG